MAMDPALEEKLSEIIEQEREMGADSEATKLERMIGDQGSAGAGGDPGGDPGGDTPSMDDPGEGAAG
jgi:hypothetical protein